MANRFLFHISVENKYFEFKREDNGIRITERHHGRRWGISLLRDEFVWWVSKLALIWRSLVPRVRTHSVSGYVRTLRLCYNLNGRFFTLEKLHDNGHSVALRFSEGCNGAGWYMVIDAAQKVGPYVKFIGSQGDPEPSSEHLSCRNCGSTDIIKSRVVYAAAEGGRVMAIATDLGGIGNGRRENQGKNNASVIFGDLPPISFSNA